MVLLDSQSTQVTNLKETKGRICSRIIDTYIYMHLKVVVVLNLRDHYLCIFTWSW